MAKNSRLMWIRWLSARGIPPGHVARVLGCGPSDVAEALRTRHGRTRYDIGPGVLATARRMRSEGATFREIGDAVGVPYYVIHWQLQRPPWSPRVPARPPGPGVLRGPVGTRCRRLHELGYGPDRVAELLGLEPDQVVDFLARDGRRKDPPRWPDWHRSNGPEYRETTEPLPLSDAPDVCQVDALDAAELVPEPEIPPAMPGVWGPHGAPRPGALDADAVRRLRYWRNRGIELDELARWFSCSVATIKRALQPSYRPAPSPELPAPLPPAAAAAEMSEMVRWDPADDD